MLVRFGPLGVPLAGRSARGHPQHPPALSSWGRILRRWVDAFHFDVVSVVTFDVHKSILDWAVLSAVWVEGGEGASWLQYWALICNLGIILKVAHCA